MASVTLMHTHNYLLTVSKISGPKCEKKTFCLSLSLLQILRYHKQENDGNDDNKKWGYKKIDNDININNDERTNEMLCKINTTTTKDDGESSSSIAEKK